MARYELPRDLTAAEERAVLEALERALEPARGRPAAWALGGRMEALRMGTLQVRRLVERPWSRRGDFTRRGTSPLIGRGDAK